LRKPRLPAHQISPVEPPPVARDHGFCRLMQDIAWSMPTPRIAKWLKDRLISAPRQSAARNGALLPISMCGFPHSGSLNGIHPPYQREVKGQDAPACRVASCDHAGHLMAPTAGSESVAIRCRSPRVGVSRSTGPTRRRSTSSPGWTPARAAPPASTRSRAAVCINHSSVAPRAAPRSRVAGLTCAARDCSS